MHRTQLNYPVRCLFYTFQQRHVCLPGNFNCKMPKWLCPSINHLGVTDEMWDQWKILLDFYTTRKCKSLPGFSLHGKYFWTFTGHKKVQIGSCVHQDSPFACTTLLIALSAGCPTDYWTTFLFFANPLESQANQIRGWWQLYQISAREIPIGKIASVIRRLVSHRRPHRREGDDDYEDKHCIRLWIQIQTQIQIQIQMMMIMKTNTGYLSAHKTPSLLRRSAPLLRDVGQRGVQCV